MQLNDILEENSVKSIAERTNISEENLEALFSGEFDVLKKVKTMGFISIIEREYGADLSSLKKQAVEYYDTHAEEESIMLEAPVIERKKGKSKLLIFSVIVLLGFASWYFITQFDQEKLRGLLPFNEEKMVSTIKEAVDHNPDLSIEHAISTEDEENKSAEKSIVIEATPMVAETNETENNQTN
jgi:cytoskeletal protein RodZ